VSASGKQRAGGDGGDVYDVRVVAFAGGSTATLQALQDLFGLDRAGAQRLVDSVPLVVRRAAPANEAQTFVDALRSIGAQVALERPSNSNAVDRPGPTAARGAEPTAMPKPARARPAPPGPVRVAPPPPPRAAPGKGPPPPPRDADPLPRPIMRALTADLEFDLAEPRGGDGVDSDSGSSIQQTSGKQGGSRGRNEIDFSDEPDTGRLELDIGSARAPSSDRNAADRKATSERSTASRGTASDRSAAKTMQQPIAPEHAAADSRAEQYAGRMSNPDVVRGGAGPMSRAAVVHKPGIESKDSRLRRRQIALARVLGAVAIGTLGVVFDVSIVHGNANVASVLAHALAIYQFGVGLRGMTS
jgi:hypothetical protein